MRYLHVGAACLLAALVVFGMAPVLLGAEQTVEVRQLFSGGQTPDDALAVAKIKAKPAMLKQVAAGLGAETRVGQAKLDQEHLMALASALYQVQVLSQKNFVSGQDFGVAVTAAAEKRDRFTDRLVMLLGDRSLLDLHVRLQRKEQKLLAGVLAWETRKGAEAKGGAEELGAAVQNLAAVGLTVDALGQRLPDGYSDSGKVEGALKRALQLDDGLTEALAVQGDLFALTGAIGGCSPGVHSSCG